MQMLLRGCRGELAGERIRLAVLKLSNGNLEELRRAITEARQDWRDVLVWAGFGDSGTAHRRWAQRVRASSLTEADWESSTDPLLMLTALRRKASARKLRLFAAACARCALPRMGAGEPEWHARVRNALEALDQFLVGEATRHDLSAAAFTGPGRSHLSSEFSWWWRKDGAARAVAGAIRACEQQGTACEAAVLTVVEDAMQGCRPKQRAAERRTQAALLRCLFGNLFRPRRVRTFPTHVVGLAKSIHAAFPAVSEEYAILADALEELGEGQAAMHCRQAIHARGCHIVDLLLRHRR
jgi:hypothetical protein